jgi:ATP-dependent DNA helicase DinG
VNETQTLAPVLSEYAAHLPSQAVAYHAVRPATAGADGTQLLSVPELRQLWGQEALIIANAPLMRARLFGNRHFREARHYDVLELFAFVRPAQFCAPLCGGSGYGLWLR